MVLPAMLLPACQGERPENAAAPHIGPFGVPRHTYVIVNVLCQA